MTIWTIEIKTIAQHNIHCVDSISKIEPYITECLKKIRMSKRYKLKWLVSDFGIIYELDKNGKEIFNIVDGISKFGEVTRYHVH